MSRQRVQRRSAFTLMEVLMVAAILALLAAFAVPTIMRQGERARIDICKGAVGHSGTIASALDSFRFDVGRYPDTREGLEALFERPSDIDEDSEMWKGPYLKGALEELRDPWQQEFEYKSPGEFNEDTYDLWSRGPDRDDGTDDDIKNWIEK